MVATETYKWRSYPQTTALYDIKQIPITIDAENLLNSTAKQINTVLNNKYRVDQGEIDDTFRESKEALELTKEANGQFNSGKLRFYMLLALGIGIAFCVTCGGIFL